MWGEREKGRVTENVKGDRKEGVGMTEKGWERQKEGKHELQRSWETEK